MKKIELLGRDTPTVHTYKRPSISKDDTASSRSFSLVELRYIFLKNKRHSRGVQLWSCAREEHHGKIFLVIHEMSPKFPEGPAAMHSAPKNTTAQR